MILGGNLGIYTLISKLEQGNVKRWIFCDWDRYLFLHWLGCWGGDESYSWAIEVGRYVRDMPPLFFHFYRDISLIFPLSVKDVGGSRDRL